MLDAKHYMSVINHLSVRLREEQCQAFELKSDLAKQRKEYRLLIKENLRLRKVNQ